MFFESGGEKINYELRGESGAPLVLLHGWGGGIKSMEVLMRDFSDSRRVLALDFPGHGLSPEPGEPLTIARYAELTAALMRHAGFEGADIIAHSFGGRVAIIIASEMPELAGKLLLTGCAGIPPKPDAKKSARARRYQRLKRLADNAFTRRAFGKKADEWKEALVQKYGSADYKALSPKMRATFNNVISRDLTSCLPVIKSPVRLVWGAEDTETPLWMGEIMAEKIPGATLTRFAGCGHYAYAEQYPRFLAIAREFLK